MPKPVKTRSYDSSRRQAQTRATRARVVSAARRLFLEQGYTATTVDAISVGSDTPPATVYRLFGSKRGILAAVFDVTVAGDDEPVAVHDRQTAQNAAAEDDPNRKLAGYARLARELLDRSAPLHNMLRDAAVSEPDVRELRNRIIDQRLAGQSIIAAALADQDALAPGITEADALDIIYTLMSPEVHHLLIVERGWSADRYGLWLGDALAKLLLPPR